MNETTLFFLQNASFHLKEKGAKKSFFLNQSLIFYLFNQVRN